MRQWTACVGVRPVTLILALTVSLWGSCQDTRRNDHVASKASESHELRVIVPQASWEPIFFREIDERAKLANLASLRTIVLPSDDLQIRIWFQAGYYGMDGIVLRRTSGTWAATYLHGSSKDPNFQKYEEQMQVPQSGWDITWQRLVDSGLLTMPDASQVACNVFGKDGAAFIIETNVNKTYRTYMYDNPAFAECAEAKHVLKLIDIVNEEFSLDWPTTQ